MSTLAQHLIIKIYKRDKIKADNAAPAYII